MRVVNWLLRAFVFFALFAFALNNREPVTVHWFFGADWSAPLVIVVLVAFGIGCAVGVLAMVPGWWARRQRRPEPPDEPTPPPERPSALPAPSGFAATHPPREGL